MVALWSANEPYARILGFDSSMRVLAHSVWDFYFHRAERTAFIDRLTFRRELPCGGGLPAGEEWSASLGYSDLRCGGRTHDNRTFSSAL